jgi:hypothetical protein
VENRNKSNRDDEEDGVSKNVEIFAEFDETGSQTHASHGESKESMFFFACAQKFRACNDDTKEEEAAFIIII